MRKWIQRIPLLAMLSLNPRRNNSSRMGGRKILNIALQEDEQLEGGNQHSSKALLFLPPTWTL